MATKTQAISNFNFLFFPLYSLIHLFAPHYGYLYPSIIYQLIFFQLGWQIICYWHTFRKQIRQSEPKCNTLVS